MRSHRRRKSLDKSSARDPFGNEPNQVLYDLYKRSIEHESAEEIDEYEIASGDERSPRQVFAEVKKDGTLVLPDIQNPLKNLPADATFSALPDPANFKTTQSFP